MISKQSWFMILMTKILLYLNVSVSVSVCMLACVCTVEERCNKAGYKFTLQYWK